MEGREVIVKSADLQIWTPPDHYEKEESLSSRACIIPNISYMAETYS